MACKCARVCVFFNPSSSSKHLRIGRFHCALSRLGCRASAEDEECFLRSAVDFYRSLPSEKDKESFVSTFRALAPHETTFHRLDAALAAL